MEQVATQCPEVEVGRAYTDCSEYPCLVWLPEQMDDPSLRDCPAWPYDRSATGWGWDKPEQPTDRPKRWDDPVQGTIDLTVAPGPSDAPPYWDLDHHYRLVYRIQQRVEEAHQYFGGVYATARAHRMP